MLDRFFFLFETQHTCSSYLHVIVLHVRLQQPHSSLLHLQQMHVLSFSRLVHIQQGTQMTSAIFLTLRANVAIRVLVSSDFGTYCQLLVECFWICVCVCVLEEFLFFN